MTIESLQRMAICRPPIASLDDDAPAGQPVPRTSLFRAIVDQAPVGIVVERGGEIVLANRRAGELLGWSPASLVGRSIEVVWADPASTHAVAACAPGLDVERTLLRRDGSRFPARVQCTSLERAGDASSETAGTVWTFEDVSAQRRAMDALMRASTELRHRVDERMRELEATHDRLHRRAEERIAAEARFRHLAHHDVLTGLPNRRLLEERLEEAVGTARRDGRGLAVLFVDLDRFKSVNDTLGHAVGDQLLRAVAGRLRESLRPCDTVARLGGDEFVVLLPDVATAQAASETAARLLDHLCAPYGVADHVLHVTASIGIALYPRDGADPRSLLERADVAMYKAKSLGRHCCHLAAAANEGSPAPSEPQPDDYSAAA